MKDKRVTKELSSRGLGTIEVLKFLRKGGSLV